MHVYMYLLNRNEAFAVCQAYAMVYLPHASRKGRIVSTVQSEVMPSMPIISTQEVNEHGGEGTLDENNMFRTW